MKNYLLMLFMCVGLSSCFEDGIDSEIVAQNLSKVEDYDSIDRPCSTQDISCIRCFFAQHSSCKTSHGPAPDPLRLERLIAPLANSNITFVLNNVEIGGLNGEITEFYINKKTDNLVIAVELRKLSVYSPHTNLRYHRKAKEPIVLSGGIIISFRSVTVTAVIPNIENLELTNAEVTVHLEDTSPTYAIEPSIMRSSDTLVQTSFSKLVANVPDNVKEAFVFQGLIFISTFIQYNICDFGLKTSSN